jgi:dUTP pyrophosphatase
VPNGGTVKIPLGFGLDIPDGYFGLVYIRSSMAAKGLSMEMPPIDPGYTGQIHALITNHSGNTVLLEAGDRIGQLVIQPVIYADFVKSFDEERGTGAFGSTGK